MPVLGQLLLVHLGERNAAPVVVTREAADRGQGIRGQSHEALQCKPASHVFDMRIQSAILMNHKDASDLRRLLVARIGAIGTNQVCLDAAIPTGGRDCDVAGLDAFIVLSYLLGRGILRHEQLKKGGHGESTDGEFLQLVHESTAADHTMNKQVVKLDGFTGQIRFL